MKLILFYKTRKKLSRFQNRKKNPKKFFSFVENAFEPVVGIYLNYEENTCDRHSTCYQTVLRFQIWLIDIFSNLICLGLMENKHERAAVQILSVFAARDPLDFLREFWKRSFRTFK